MFFFHETLYIFGETIIIGIGIGIGPIVDKAQSAIGNRYRAFTNVQKVTNKQPLVVAQVDRKQNIANQLARASGKTSVHRTRAIVAPNVACPPS